MSEWVQWRSVKDFGWSIPYGRKKYYTNFVKKFHLEKWARIDDGLSVLSLVKFMNGDPSHNAGLHVDHPALARFYPYMDHSVVFQGKEPWMRVLTCGDYVDEDDELDFQDEFGCAYGLENVMYPYDHWRNDSMYLSVFTTQKYTNYLVKKYDEAFSISGSPKPTSTIMIKGSNETKLKQSIPEILKPQGYMYAKRFTLDTSKLQSHPECPFNFKIESPDFSSKRVTLIPDLWSDRFNVQTP